MWLDIGIAVAGFAGGIAGLVLGWRYLRQAPEAGAAVVSRVEAPSFVPPVAQPEPTPVVPPPVPVAPLVQPAPPTQTGPCLVLDRVYPLGGDSLRISLRNDGDKLFYEALEVGDLNELSVQYDPPVFRQEESYTRGTSIQIKVQGAQLRQRAYHFVVCYKDETGRPYRQEVSGRGKDTPHIAAPVRTV
ncbi:MAG: hypothetical protein OHK0039_33010 [Bacteroidia bacterium]